MNTQYSTISDISNTLGCCVEKEKLLCEIKRIGAELAVLDAELLRSALAGDALADMRRISRSRELQALLVERLRNHVVGHGCLEDVQQQARSSQALS